MTDLATIGINVVVEGQQQAIAGLNQVAAAADTKVSPAAKRVIENFQKTQEVMKRLEQQSQSLNRSFTLAELQKAGQRVANLENVLNNTRQGMNSFGVITQQAGYQVGDFIVQVQSGTNAFVAFGQQATQMVGFLPMLATELGIAKVSFMGLSLSMATVTLGLSIIIPLVTAFGAAWMRTTEAAGNSKSAMDSYKELLTSLNSKIVDVNKNLEAFRRGVEPDQIFETVLAIEELTSTLDTLRNTPIEGFMDSFTRADRIAAAQALKTELEKALKTLREQQAEEQRLETAAKRRANEVRDHYREQEKAKQAHADQVKLMGDQLAAQGRMKTAAEAVLEKYGMMRTVAAGVANELSRAADESFRMAQQKLAASGLTYSGRGGDPRKSNQQGYGKFVYTGPALDANNNVIPQNTGGGGSKVNPIESLINQLQTQQETVDEWYKTSQDSLKSASEAELEILGGKYEAMARLDAEYRKKTFDAQQAQAQMSFQAYSGMFSALGDLLSVFGNESKGAAVAALAIQKGLAIAQIVVSTASAQMRALAELGPIAGSAMAAKIGVLGKIQMGLVAATGLAQAASIGRGSVSSGGSSGGRGSATVANSSAPAQAPQTVYIDSIKPESLYSGETLIKLFDSFYDENDKRGKVFMVAR